MAGSQSQIDMTYLQDMSGGDLEFIGEILSTFLETSVDLVDAIQTAARDGDVDKAVYACHTLKGSLKSIGADPLAALCQDLESVSRSGDMHAFNVLARELPAGFALLRGEIDAVFQDRAA